MKQDFKTLILPFPLNEFLKLSTTNVLGQITAVMIGRRQFCAAASPVSTHYIPVATPSPSYDNQKCFPHIAKIHPRLRPTPSNAAIGLKSANLPIILILLCLQYITQSTKALLSKDYFIPGENK